MLPPLESCPSLVLNADFRPLSYFPLSLWSWQETIKAVFMDRVSVLSEYDRVVHSPSLEVKLPSVISLKDYVPPNRRPSPGSTCFCEIASPANIAGTRVRPSS